MKALLPAMTSHLSQEVTTLCTCWKIVRKDGEVYGFTDHDVDLVFDGLPYESETGYNRTAMTNDASMSVNNLDVTGFLDSDRISENDLRNGLFDYAAVYIFAVNWMAPDATGDVKLRRGWFGEVTINQNGVFEAEIRGLHQALSIGFMESYQPECRADFCDARCKLNIVDYTYPGTVLVTSSSQSVFQASQLPAVPTTGVTTVGAHRYWRIRMTGTFDTDYVGFAEAKFYDQADAVINGGTAAAFSVRDTSGDFLNLGIGGTDYHASNARDGSVSSMWQCKKGDAETSWWSIDFGSDKDVKSVMLVAPKNNYQIAPLSFVLEYSDNNANWFFAMDCSAAWTGNGQEETWTIGTPTSDPIDFPTTLTALPPPFAGASTYVGGTITFTSGANRGKTLEIIDFVDATNTVTVIEGFPYQISQGDKFDIAQGCDKNFTTCKVYNNVVNFRGEPHVPGQDEMLNYPDAHD